MVIRLADNYLILPEWTTTKGAQAETHTHSLKEQRAVVKGAFVLLMLSKRWPLYGNVGATLSSRDDLMMGLGRERRRRTRFETPFPAAEIDQMRWNAGRCFFMSMSLQKQQECSTSFANTLNKCVH